MPGVEEIIQKVEMLPIDEQFQVVDSVLRTLHEPDPEVKQLWIAEVNHRIEAYRSGQITPISADEVLAKFRERFPKQ